jgi:anti-sigma factor RsiW
MKHVNDIEMIEYVAGKLTASRNEEVREHMAACEECSDRRRKAVEAWNALGKWSVDTAEHDVTQRITAKAEEEERSRKQHKNTHALQIGFLSTMVRVAASIIIAVGVGHKLGKYSVTGSTPKTAASENRPEYLAALGLEWSSELAWLILEDDSPNMGEER